MTGESDKSNVLVFAYGSNLSIGRMQTRVSTALPVTIGFVRQRRFAFHKRSVDGSAKADAVLTTEMKDRVWGVVYQLQTQQKPLLDRYEFLGVGYDEAMVDVICKSSIIPAWMYVARPDAIDSSLLPYRWYHDLIIEGARSHGLPEPYIDFLKSFDSVEDSDRSRDLENRKHLTAMD